MLVNFRVCSVDRLAGNFEMYDFYAWLGKCNTCVLLLDFETYETWPICIFDCLWIFGLRRASYIDSIECLLEICLKFDLFRCIKKYKEMIWKYDGSYIRPK